MNRTGLAFALAVALLIGGVFGVFPQLDLDLARLFFDPTTQTFATSSQSWEQYVRDAVRWLIALLAAPAAFAIVGKVILPRVRMLIPGRAALFLLLSLALGPGILANTILKDHWGRYRPSGLIEFGGTDQPFTPWWDPRGTCVGNCSFIAGEPSGAFWTLAPAALAPPQWRLLAYTAAVAFGAAVGALRMASGAHFCSDVVFAGILMFLLLWALHGLIYRWRATRLADGTVEWSLTRAGEALRVGFSALTRRVGARAGKLF